MINQAKRKPYKTLAISRLCERSEAIQSDLHINLYSVLLRCIQDDLPLFRRLPCIKNHLKHIFSYGLLVSSLFGCALYGPKYTKPKVVTPIAWKSPDALTHVSDKTLPTLAWWEKFHSKQLNQLVDKAVSSNNNIQVAVGNVLAAQGELLQVQTSWIPSVSGLLLSYTTNNVNFLIPGYNSGFLPSYAFNVFQFIRSNEWASAKMAASLAAKDTVQLSIISQTVAGYFTYLGQSYLLTQQKQLVADLKELLFLSKKQYQEGLISLYTLQQYEQQYEKAKVDLPPVANNVVLAANALRLLLNENPEPLPIGYDFMQLKSNEVLPTNLPSQVLLNRPDVREAEQKLIAANANIGVVTATFFPTFSLIGSAGTSSNELNHLFAADTSYWHYFAGLTMPMLAPAFNGQYKNAQGLRYAAFRNYIQTVRGAFQSVDNDLSAHQQYYNSLMAQKKNYVSSQEAYRLAALSYAKGLYSYPTLLVNKVNMDNAAIDLTKSKLLQLHTIVQLYQDLGSGYAYTCKRNA